MVLSSKKSRKTNGNKNNPHVCSVCLKSFAKLSLLERHLRVHSGERPFICEHCNKGFNQKGTLQIHLSKHTGIKPFHCTLCSARFNQKGNLRVHVEKTHTAPMPGIKMYKCPHCTCIFKKIASLNVHITKCHASSEEVGDIKNVMSQLKELEKHTVVTPDMKDAEREVTEQNRKVLNEIKKIGDGSNTSYVRLAESFLDGTVRRYLVMQRKVNDVKWYICSYCNKEFKKPSDLIRHTRVHTREKPFTCKQCGASFSLKSTLFYHAKTHISNNSYFCAICMKKFSSVRSLNVHLRKHAEKPQYKCSTCNKWFPSIQKAKLHDKEVHKRDQVEIQMKQPLLNTPNGLLPVTSQKSTENQKQYPCPSCSNRFSKIPNLKRHVLLHNGERKFKCDHCLKSYFTAHALKEHMLYHSGVRNFDCKVCGKKFMTSSLMKRHLISHNTNKPYVCPYCKKNFKSVILCRKHINVHKKEIKLQIRALSETGEIQNLTGSDKTKLDLPLTPTNNVTEISNNLLGTQKIENLTLPQVTQVKDASSAVIPNQEGQQSYEITSNSIQIITNSDKDLQDASQVQTIFINCEDLELAANLYSQNADALLFSSMNTIPDSNTLTINPLIDGQNIVCDSSQVITTDENAVNILKTNVNLKPKGDKLSLPVATVNLTDGVLTNSLPYYSQSELNLLFNLGPEFETNNCDLPNENLNLPDINLNEAPDLNIEQDVAPEDDKKEKKPFVCNNCNKVFTNKKMYMKHLHSHRDLKKTPNLHPCTFCFKSFKKHSDLVRHLRTHTGEKPFTCDQCDKSFSLKSTLLSHQRTHNPVLHKQFSCVVCNSFFSSKSSLKVHMSVHTGDKTHQCNFCSMKFRTAAHRKSHENNFHINSSNKRAKSKVTNLLASVAMDVLAPSDQKCLQNEQIIPNGKWKMEMQNVLIVHEQMQLPEDQLNVLNGTNQTLLSESTQLEPLLMQQLQSNFLLQDNLMPSLIHLDDGTLLNVKTDNSEQTEQILNVDLLVSEKPRNLECDICHKKYASKDVLRKHRKIHGIGKKFRCIKCEKGFDTEASLHLHVKTHDGFRPFLCLYCSNSFSKEHSLTTHMRRIHNITLKDFLTYDLK